VRLCTRSFSRMLSLSLLLSCSHLPLIITRQPLHFLNTFLRHAIPTTNTEQHDHDHHHVEYLFSLFILFLFLLFFLILIMTDTATVLRVSSAMHTFASPPLCPPSLLLHDANSLLFHDADLRLSHFPINWLPLLHCGLWPF
jgi:hypothetical protein